MNQPRKILEIPQHTGTLCVRFKYRCIIHKNMFNTCMCLGAYGMKYLNDWQYSVLTSVDKELTYF